MLRIIRACDKALRAAGSGRVGTVMRSRDADATWQNLGFPVQPNSAVWTVSLPASAPDTVRAAAMGYLYRSPGASSGESSVRSRRSFGCSSPREHDKENPS